MSKWWARFILLVLLSLLSLSTQACPNNQFPCTLFDIAEQPIIVSRVTGGVTESTQAYNSFQSSCSYNTLVPGNSNTGPQSGPDDEYHECAFRCLVDGADCSNAKTAMFTELADVPATTIGNAKLHAHRLIRAALTFEWLMAANQLSPAEQTTAVHGIQDWLQFVNTLDISSGQLLSSYTHVDNNGAIGMAAANAIGALTIIDHPDVTSGPAYTSQTALQNIITINRDRIEKGNKDIFDIEGNYVEGFRYTAYGVQNGMFLAVKALANNGYGTEAQLFGPAIFNPYWTGYALLADSQYPLYADTSHHTSDNINDALAVRVGYASYLPLTELWQQDPVKARFALNRLNHIYTTIQSNGQTSIASHHFSPYLGRALFYPDQITFPQNYDPDNELKPAHFFRDNNNVNDAYGNYDSVLTSQPGTGGTLVLHSPEITDGQRKVSLIHYTQGEFSVHRGPDSGSLAVAMRDVNGDQKFIVNAGYIVQNGWIGANNVDENIINPSGWWNQISGNHFNYKPYDGTTKAKVLGWDQTYYRATHNYVWKAEPGSRMLYFRVDDTNPYALFLDEATDLNPSTAQPQSGSFNQYWHSHVQATSSGNQLSMTGNGKTLRMSYHYPASNFLSFTLPSTTSQLSLNHDAYNNKVTQNTPNSNPDASITARFFYVMTFEFPGVSQPTQANLPVTNGAGVRLTFANGEQHYLFARFEDYTTMSYMSPSFILNPTDAKFVAVHVDSAGIVQKYAIGEGSDVDVFVNGNQVQLLTVPSSTKVNVALGSLALSQVNPHGTVQPVPDMTAYILNPTSLSSPVATEDITWNDQPVSTYTVNQNFVVIGSSSCSVPCDPANANPSCSGITCTLNCNQGYSSCDGNTGTGCETNIFTSLSNCGQCGYTCQNPHGTTQCSSGACSYGCSIGWEDCDPVVQGCETNTDSDPNNCGGCGTVCSLPNVATNTCASGNCGVGTCAPGWIDANNLPSDGCEQALTQCNDNIDNEGDGFCDLPTSTCSDGSTPGDPECTDLQDDSESPVCGNGIIEPGEICDDGNTNSGDGCNINCQFELGRSVTVSEFDVKQTIHNWEATAWAGQFSSGQFNAYKDQLFDIAVNDLGITRLRVEIRSGAENAVDTFGVLLAGGIPVDPNSQLYQNWRDIRYLTVNDNNDPFVINPAGFFWTELDYTIQNVVLPMKQRIEANGENLYFNLNYVGFSGNVPTTQYHHVNADEYAEFILAVFQHLDQTYGIIPDGLEVILEPDNPGSFYWDENQLALAIETVVARLAANGYTPDIIAPSTITISIANSYLDALATNLNNPNAINLISEASYHLYGGNDPWMYQLLSQKAQLYGFTTSSLEGNNPTPDIFFDDITFADQAPFESQANSAWGSRYPLSSFGTIASSFSSCGGWIRVDDSVTPYQIALCPNARETARVTKYVRPGATRVKALTNSADLRPMSFINVDGNYVIAVKATTAGNINFVDLPPGDYEVTFSNTQGDQLYPMQTVTPGTVLTVNVPGDGTLSVVELSPSTCNDLDGDGYGNPGDPSCLNGGQTDCNDNNVNIHPGAVEICDGVDNNCDTQIDEGGACQTYTLQNAQATVTHQDSPSGIYLKEIQDAAGNTISFGQTNFFTIDVYDGTNVISITPGDFSTRLTQINGNILTTTYNDQSITPGLISVTTTTTLTEASADYDIVIDNQDPQYSILKVSYPNIAVQPIGADPTRDVLTVPFYGGALYHYPSSQESTTISHPGPSAFQMFSMYSIDEPQMLYLQTMDGSGYYKEYAGGGLQGLVAWTVNQYPENGDVPQNDYASPYSTRIGIRTGNWYDAAIEYKNWAIGQPWMNRGKLYNNPQTSTKLDDLKIYALFSTDHVTPFDNFGKYVEEGRRIRDYYGLQQYNLLLNWYDWHNNVFGQFWPDIYPVATTFPQAVADAHTEGFIVMPYVNWHVWEHLSPSYQASGVVNWEARDINDNPILISNNMVHLDPSIPGVRTHSINLLGQLSLTYGLQAVYLDFWSGLQGSLDFASNHGHPTGGGNYWNQGKRQLGTDLKNAANQFYSDFIVTSENLEENLLDKVDIMFSGTRFSGLTRFPLFETIYNEYILQADHGALTVPISTQIAEDAYKFTLAVNFHSGRLASLPNWFAATEYILEAPASSTPGIGFHEFAKKHVDTHAWTSKYTFFGERLRPLDNSLERFYETLNTQGNLNIINSIWRAQDGDIGILVSNRGSSPEASSITLQYSNYGLSGEYTLAQNINGIRTPLLNSVSSDFTYPFTIPQTSLIVFELLQCLDNDGDGYSPTPTNNCQNQLPDCDDNNIAINPGAAETCDGIDNNCDGSTDEGLTEEECDFVCIAAGYNYDPLRTLGLQCCGNDPQEDNPYQTTETLCDGNDNDCDGTIDQGLLTTYYQDSDNDGYGNNAVSLQSCTPPQGYVTDNTDCDDTNQNINPGVAEDCTTSYDDNCDGVTNEGCDCTSQGGQTCITGQGCTGTQITYGTTSNCCEGICQTPQTCGECDSLLFLTCTQAVCQSITGENCYYEQNTCNTCTTIQTCSYTQQGTCESNLCDVNQPNGCQWNTQQQACEQALPPTTCTDNDQDGYSVEDGGTCCGQTGTTQCQQGSDCNDNDPAVNPGMQEDCTTTYDDNCDGTTNEGCDCTSQSYFSCTGGYDCLDGPLASTGLIAQNCCTVPCTLPTTCASCGTGPIIQPCTTEQCTLIGNCGYTNGQCIDCTPVLDCTSYTSQETCDQNTCSLANACTWNAAQNTCDPGNQPPTFTNLASTYTTNEGALFEITVQASDPENDQLIFTTSTLPGLSTFTSNPTQGLFSWQIDFDASSQSPYQLTFTIDDGTNIPVSQTVAIFVLDCNLDAASLEWSLDGQTPIQQNELLNEGDQVQVFYSNSDPQVNCENVLIAFSVYEDDGAFGTEPTQPLLTIDTVTITQDVAQASWTTTWQQDINNGWGDNDPEYLVYAEINGHPEINATSTAPYVKVLQGDADGDGLVNDCDGNTDPTVGACGCATWDGTSLIPGTTPGPDTQCSANLCGSPPCAPDEYSESYQPVPTTCTIQQDPNGLLTGIYIPAYETTSPPTPPAGFIYEPSIQCLASTICLSCGADDDGDGVYNRDDLCPGTLPVSVGPPAVFNVNNYGQPLPLATEFTNQHFISPQGSIATTDFVNEDLSQATLVLANNHGVATWDTPIDLVTFDPLYSPACQSLDLDAAVEIGPGILFVNETNASILDMPATLTLTNTYLSSPLIFLNGQQCNSCTLVSNQNGLLTFHVPGFS